MLPNSTIVVERRNRTSYIFSVLISHLDTKLKANEIVQFKYMQTENKIHLIYRQSKFTRNLQHMKSFKIETKKLSKP